MGEAKPVEAQSETPGEQSKGNKSTLDEQALLIRPALYYPYIHIRNEHWLKATLLCTPVVKRIVPADYKPEDLPNILKYTTTKGPEGNLLQSVRSSSPAADGAQRRLLDKLSEHEKDIRRRFQRSHSTLPDQYWIHDAKFNQRLLEFLTSRDLAWHSPSATGFGNRAWYALHPTLGSAIMTTLGISIAKEQHYDIVTDSINFHETLLATQENEIFERLLQSSQPEQPPTKVQVRRDLGQMVITLTGVNYQALRPEDIAELQESENFQKFRRLIRVTAQSIERESEEYYQQLSQEADNIIEAWRDTKQDLGRDLRKAVFDGVLTLSVEALKALIKHSTPDLTDLKIAGGVAVGRLIGQGITAARKGRRAPYQYLTEILQAEHEPLRLTFPLGLQR